MKLDLTKIKFSRFDIKRGVHLPVKFDEQLAEDIGIMIGDGHIGKKARFKRAVDYQVIFSGNAITDKEYATDYVRKLKLELYGLKFPISLKGKNKTEIRLKICSRALVEFYTKVIGLPLNKKINIGIPRLIWNNRRFLKACLRGIVDTDFSFCIKRNNYPVLKLKTASERLVRDCKSAFELLGFETSIQTNAKEFDSRTNKEYTTHYLYLSGRAKIEKYIREIGFSNATNLKQVKNYTGAMGFEPTTFR